MHNTNIHPWKHAGKVKINFFCNNQRFECDYDADEDRVDRYDDVFCRDRVPSYLRRYRIMPSPPWSIQHSHASAKQMAIDGDIFIFIHNKNHIGDFHASLSECFSLFDISIHGPRHISNHFSIHLAFLSKKKQSNRRWKENSLACKKTMKIAIFLGRV